MLSWKGTAAAGGLERLKSTHWESFTVKISYQNGVCCSCPFGKNSVFSHFGQTIFWPFAKVAIFFHSRNWERVKLNVGRIKEPSKSDEKKKNYFKFPAGHFKSKGTHFSVSFSFSQASYQSPFCCLACAELPRGKIFFVTRFTPFSCRVGSEERKKKKLSNDISRVNSPWWNKKKNDYYLELVY